MEHPLDVPAVLKRDKDNKAPYMIENVHPTGRNFFADLVASPANSPPASPPSWVPPWASTS